VSSHHHTRRPTIAPHFPYTTLFRSIEIAEGGYEALAPVITLELNTKRAPLDDKRVRQAIAYAIDRDFITKNIWYEVAVDGVGNRSEEHTSELQSRENLVCRLLLEKK